MITQNKMKTNYILNSFKMKQLLIAMFVLLLVTPLALASVTVSVDDVNSGPISVVVGQTLPIQVVYNLSSNYSDVRVKAELSYGSKDVQVQSEALDLIAGTTYKVHLDMTVPQDVETDPAGDSLTLSVRLKDGKGNTLATQDYKLTVQRKGELFEIQKVLGPATGDAGKPVIWTVVVKNTGSHNQSDVYVKVTSPELGLNVEERAGDVRSSDASADEDVATVDIPLRLPKDAVDGTYTFKVEAYNDNVDVSTTKTLLVNGVTKPTDSTEVVPVAQNLDIKQGETGVFQLNLLNLGNSAQTYNFAVEGLDGWSTYQVNPVSVTLNPQANQLVNLGLTVSGNALVGEHSLRVNVLSDGKVVRDLTLAVNVQANKNGVNAMLVSVIVLAIVLVVLLVLLVKLRKSDDVESFDNEESYY